MYIIYNTILISTGLLISLLLFYRFPFLSKGKGTNPSYKISIIIPARNEEINISLLLQDLKQQIYPIHEIICVDDGSLDHTAEIASSLGAKVITIIDKPEDWTGKAWACQKGGEAASGDILLFLDADVRLSPNAISSLIQTYVENQCIVSVQPYHQTEKSFEQFSFFFNLVEIAANGTCMISNPGNVGLYGPVILIDKEIYKTIDGHRSAKKSIVDDLTLGEKLTQTGFQFKLFLGGEYISFRMYGGGFLELLWGWTKNFATGAFKTPPLLFIMMFLWITSCTSGIISLIQAISTQNLFDIIIYSCLYILWVLELSRIAPKIGNFKKYVQICFPVYMVLFIWVFVLSFIKKVFHLNVVWKDRKIKLEK